MTGSRDILVIGAGIVGCAVGYELARQGASVTIVDARPAGFGATQASAGMLAPFTEAADGGPLLELGARSLELFDRFVARVSEDSGMPIAYDRGGSLHVGRAEASLAHFAALHAVLETRGVPSHLLSGEEARAEEPNLGPGAFGGLRIDTQGHVAAFDLTRALAAAATRFGARVINDTQVRRIRAVPGGLDAQTDTGALHATTIVLAAGAWSGQLDIDGTEARVPVRPVRGQILHLGWVAQPLARITWDERCYVVPRPDQTVLVGATVEEAGFEERTTVAGVRSLMDAVCDLLPGARMASLLGVRVGLRPANADALPIIGWSQRVPGLMYATGHYRNGVLLTPLTADLVARAVLDGTADEALALTSPGRFGDL